MTQALTASDAKRDLFCRAIASISPEAIRRARIRAAIHASDLCTYREPEYGDAAFRVDTITIGKDAVVLQGTFWWHWHEDAESDEETVTITYQGEDLYAPLFWCDDVYSEIETQCDCRDRLGKVWLGIDPQDCITWEGD